MKTDTARLEQGGFSASSSDLNRGRNSDRSTPASRKNSKRGPAKETGDEAETKLTSLDVLLTMLQSLLGEIKDCGGDVRMLEWSDGLTVQLVNAAYCRTHKMMHGGQQCPMC